MPRRFDLGEELRSAADPTGKLSADFDPAEFNRKLKEAVEGGPPSQGTGSRRRGHGHRAAGPQRANGVAVRWRAPVSDEVISATATPLDAAPKDAAAGPARPPSPARRPLIATARSAVRPAGAADIQSDSMIAGQ